MWYFAILPRNNCETPKKSWKMSVETVHCVNFYCRFYRGTHGVIVVYDVSRIESFASIKRWLQEIENNCDVAVQKVLGLSFS